MTKRIIAIILGLLLSAAGVIAQNYPVQVTPVIMPPYSLYLADYGVSAERLQLSILLKDLNKPDFDARLRLTIQGISNTIQLVTKPTYQPQPIKIEGGVPVLLTGADIAGYFDLNNLTISGAAQQLQQNGKLPDGVYRFSFEVLDYYQGRLVSNNGSTLITAFLNQPPVINQPQNGVTLKVIQPQNVLIQWTPRSTASFNSAFSIYYKVQLVELWPEGRNPNDAFNASRPYFETITDQTLLVYGAAEPLLEPGRSYAVRVQALDAEGRDMFLNKGYSEVVQFRYGSACEPPRNVKVEEINSHSITASWEESFDINGYKVHYKEHNKLGAAWFEESTFLHQFVLEGLKAGTEYDIAVSSSCMGKDGYYGQTITAKTVLPEQGTFMCGNPAAFIEINSNDPKIMLQSGEKVKSGDFDVTITSIQGQNGTFSGEGTAYIPFLSALLPVHFENIYINKDNQLVRGLFYVPAGNNKKGIQTLDRQIADDWLASNTGTIQIGNATLDIAIPIEIAGPESIVYVPGSTTATITATDNSTHIVQVNPNASSTSIQDKSGDIYELDNKTGTVKKVGNTAAGALAAVNGNKLNLEIGSVKFVKASHFEYGFDSYQEGRKAGNYETVSENYLAAWKSTEAGQSDKVSFSVINGKVKLDEKKIRFITRTGIEYFVENKTLTIAGSSANDGQELYAYYPENGNDTTKGSNIGKLNVVSYARKSLKLVLVPVDGAIPNVLELQNNLNDIYSQAVVDWKVSVLTNFKADNKALGGDHALDIGSDALFTSYSEEMKTLIAQLKTTTGYDPNSFYIFVIGNPGSTNADVGGYMPQAKHYGFVFTNIAVNVSRTIAHELGHGAFALEHLDNDSENLMSKVESTGAALYKYQWDLIHNPKMVVSEFEEDDEGMLTISLKNIKAYLEMIRSNRIAGHSILFKANNLNVENEYEQHNIELGNYTYPNIKLRTYAKKASYSYNPALFEEYLDLKQGIFTNEVYYGIAFNDIEENRFIKILLEKRDDRDRLSQYLFGACDYLEKLQQIHTASYNKKLASVTYSNNCSVSGQVRQINSIAYDNLSCGFGPTVNKGEAVFIDPSKYKANEHGFDFYDGDKLIFYVSYYKGKTDSATYSTNLIKLKEWLFGGKEARFDIKQKLSSAQLSISSEGLSELIKHEGKVNYVYNDAKGARSRYCNEHKGHKEIKEGSFICAESEHQVIKDGKTKTGYPTIGVGHLIIGEDELQKWCNSQPISDIDVEELLKTDVKVKAEELLKNAIKNIPDAKLNQCQYDALVSIIFNRGIGVENKKGFKSSKLWKEYLKNGIFDSDDPREVEKMKDFLINDGSGQAGSNRRNDEADLYFGCTYLK
ncbi:fibronectin type III domain-containing protein [Solitalea koreensis]|uniref:Lysozyme n=1 Tax=Solitalea koreensis TaxID=543615 RepID=A0A521C1L3_9SPHI|nr:fibronectin type III domain-containing protein [Solitalea koreensis]SMO52711.1 Fibronectin type III domain-containing protein [Solitalea koreensis]